MILLRTHSGGLTLIAGRGRGSHSGISSTYNTTCEVWSFIFMFLASFVIYLKSPVCIHVQHCGNRGLSMFWKVKWTLRIPRLVRVICPLYFLVFLGYLINIARLRPCRWPLGCWLVGFSMLRSVFLDVSACAGSLAAGC